MLTQFRSALRAAMRMELPPDLRPVVAMAMPMHHPCTVEDEWDGPGAVADAPNDADVLMHMHAWRDAEADQEAKESYKFPHHAPEMDSCANLNGVRNALARLESADIPEDDVEEVRAHLQAHLDDAEEEDGDEGASVSGPQVDGLAMDDALPLGELPVRGVLILEGAPTGDGRFIEADALTHRDLPLPLMANIDHGGDHMESGLIGRIETLTRSGGGEWEFTGFVADDPDARRVMAFVSGMGRMGISADLDEMEVEWILVDEDGKVIGDSPDADLLLPVELPEGVSEQMRVSKARIMGGTVTPFPAFAEAYIELALEGPGGQGEEPPGDQPASDALPNEGIAAAGAPRSDLPAEWFADPGFSLEHEDPSLRPVEDPLTHCFAVPLTIGEDGRIFSHLASWNTCHVGFPDECVSPPASESGYAYFRTGSVLCADGSMVSVGQITMATGHAELNLGHRATLAHYDNTGVAVADVAAGEDEFGIWIAGAMREGVTDEQIRVLRASGSLSGDWRVVAGHHELVAALAVNVPGFPIPRVRVAAGEIEAMVAAGAPLVARVAARRGAPVSRSEFDAMMARLCAVERRMPIVSALGPVARQEALRRLAG